MCSQSIDTAAASCASRKGNENKVAITVFMVSMVAESWKMSRAFRVRTRGDREQRSLGRRW